MNTPSVSFDPITDIPHYVESGHYQFELDDKSGYDHISLNRTFFSLFWKGWFFVHNTLPFGWNQSSYIYHNTGLGALHFICSKCAPMSHYIDNCHVSQLGIPKCAPYSSQKFYGRYQDLIEKYQRSVNVMVNDSFPG